MLKEYLPLFEIFGPVMIGPSSSHTAGVGRISFIARNMFGFQPEKAGIEFFGSLASTWKGHGSGDAAVAGLLGIPPEDERLFHGRKILKDLQAEGKGFPVEIKEEKDPPASWHPNTLIIRLEGNEQKLKIRASSIGGGSISIDEINGYSVHLSGELDAILALHRDEVGVVAIVSHFLAAKKINIASISCHRKEKGEEALLVIEIDGTVSQTTLELIKVLPPIYQVLRFPSLRTL